MGSVTKLIVPFRGTPRILQAYSVSRLNHYLYCPYDGQRLDAGAPGKRLSCTCCGFIDYQNPKPCVAIFIVRDGKVLLARRAIEPAKGAWDLPGGFIDDGESAEKAVLREAREEMTLRVRIAKYLGSIADVYGPKETPTVNLCFLVEVTAGEPVPKSDVEALAWFPLNRLPTNMAFAHQIEAIKLLKKNLRRPS